MTAKLSDTFYLKRAGSYSNPIDSNSHLPVVYGDLTDGINGIWKLPCLNKTDWVYAFAGHEVLSVANGNSITIYEDDMVLGGAGYVFDELNNYEGHGNIATIDMVNPKDNAIITARGMGKPTVTGGATLMENIIDIVEDFLTIENNVPASIFESTAKAMAASIFTSQNYIAAGCIVQDIPIWETITKMMASFLGSVFINGEGELVLDIDINTIPLGIADIILKGDGYLSDAKIRRDNIINQCPVNYAYDYVNGRFKSHTDLSTQADAISQDVFGVRTPDTPYQQYWIRDKVNCQSVQSLIVAKLKDPLYEIEITDATLKRAGIDIGDFVAFSADSLYSQDGMQLLNAFWKVLAVRPNYGKNNIVFRALQTGHFMTIAYLLDGGVWKIVEDESGITGWWPTYPGAIFADGFAAFAPEGISLAAFAGVAGTLTPHEIILYDSALRECRAYLAEADAALALGAEIVTNPDMEAATAVFDAEDATVNGSYAQSADFAHGGTKSGKVTRTAAGAGNVYHKFLDTNDSTITSLKMYEVSAWVYIPSGQDLNQIQVKFSEGVVGQVLQTITATDEWVEVIAKYVIPKTSFIYYFLANPESVQNDVYYIDDISIKEVTALGADGCHVINTKNGSTQNWASQEAGFDYNDSAGYTFEIVDAFRIFDGSWKLGGDRDLTTY